MKTIIEAMNNLKESSNLSFESFLNNIKEEEINFYNNEVTQYYKLDNERSNYFPKDDSEEENQKWYRFIQRLDELSTDLDVSSYSRTWMDKGKEQYLKDLEKDIDNHIAKVSKTLIKEVGNIISIKEQEENIYYMEGNKATCTIKVTPIKLSKNKSITKTRIKIEDLKEKNLKDITLDNSQLQENDYIKQWKQEELEKTLDANTNFWKEYEELISTTEEIDKRLENKIDEYVNINNDYPAFIKRGTFDKKFLDKDIEEINQEYLKQKEKVRSYIERNNFFYKEGRKSNFEETCKEMINRHFIKLQNKVEDKIGEILQIKPTGNNGYDYYFKGSKGNCNIEVILAGGYNIQRLHTRWIIKNINKREEI